MDLPTPIMVTFPYKSSSRLNSSLFHRCDTSQVTFKPLKLGGDKGVTNTVASYMPLLMSFPELSMAHVENPGPSLMCSAFSLS